MSQIHTVASQSVDLDGSVDLPDEGVGGVEADGAGEEPEGDDHDDCVGEVEQGRHELVNLQLGEEEEHAVGRHVHSTAAGDYKRPRYGDGDGDGDGDRDGDGDGDGDGVSWSASLIYLHHQR